MLSWLKLTSNIRSIQKKVFSVGADRAIAWSTKIKITIIIFFCLFFLLPIYSYAAGSLLKNAGLIPSNIWYSKDPFYVGDKIRIYSVIYNGSSKDLRGRINFFDNNYLVCTSEFASLAGRVSEVWCDWTVGTGKHTISIKITNPLASIPGGVEEAVILSNSEFTDDARVIIASPIEVVQEKVVRVPETTITQPAIINDVKKIDEPTSIISKITDYVSQALGFSVPSGTSNGITLDNKPNAIDTTITIKVPGLSAVENSKLATKRVDRKITGAAPATSALKPEKRDIFGRSNIQGDTLTSQSASIPQTGPLTYLASIHDQILSFASKLPFLGIIKDWILDKVGSYQNSDNKPVAYIMLFVFTIVKFLLDSPIILSLLALYILWRIAKFLFKGWEYYS